MYIKWKNIVCHWTDTQYSMFDSKLSKRKLGQKSFRLKPVLTLTWVKHNFLSCIIDNWYVLNASISPRYQNQNGIIRIWQNCYDRHT